AAVWTTGQLDSLALHHARRVELFTQANWAQALLPFVGETDLAAQFHSERPIGAAENAAARNTRLALMTCPGDSFNSVANPFRLLPGTPREMTLARGNYAINAGSHGLKDGPGSTSHRTGDEAHLVMDRQTREFRYWGNGIAGFNVTFSLDDFENGSGSLVALEEVRAGVHAIDPRGVWALGQIGGSVTWGHGANGDAYGPNNQHPKSDDLLDGDLLNKTVGSATLQKLGMPCVDYVNFNSQATSRSQHAGGVNLVMVDGAVRFVSDAIDPGLWHALHSRETPREILTGNLDLLIADSMQPQESNRTTDRTAENAALPESLENSLGMTFQNIPAGTFEMGIPDQGNSHDLPPEVPQHQVTISHTYLFGIHEVTREQYAHVIGELPGTGSDADPGEAIDASLPMVNVTWNQAQDFCVRLSELDAEQSAGRRYRLPTEAEWEYACRAGSHAPYRWRPTRDPTDDSGETAGIEPALPLTPVGTYRPNPFGLHDMRGNAWEWCDDWFDRDCYARSPANDPQGPQTGFLKVIRGSNWTFIGEGCKLSYAAMPHWKANPFVGFRVVCDMQPRR
ncbi:MAG TPA: SUMF1/EgtB/PvdO family nonheme iron enzyme, partial [Planctomycetaceae bacterium]|nr:SUMF1/EgtB/PvdO family nonheme iron enzyme [Planctomycetaceae bacterium]